MRQKPKTIQPQFNNFSRATVPLNETEGNCDIHYTVYNIFHSIMHKCNKRAALKAWRIYLDLEFLWTRFYFLLWRNNGTRFSTSEFSSNESFAEFRAFEIETYQHGNWLLYVLCQVFRENECRSKLQSAIRLKVDHERAIQRVYCAHNFI